MWVCFYDQLDFELYNSNNNKSFRVVEGATNKIKLIKHGLNELNVLTFYLFTMSLIRHNNYCDN